MDAIRLVRPDGHHRGEVELPAADARHGGHGVEQMAAATHLGFGRFAAQERRLERRLGALALARFLLGEALVALARAWRAEAAHDAETSNASTASADPDRCSARFKPQTCGA